MEELHDILCTSVSGTLWPKRMQGRIQKCVRSHRGDYYLIRKGSPNWLKGCIISGEEIANGNFMLLEPEEEKQLSKFKEGDKVIVVKADKDTYWYADHIGEVFTLGAKLEDSDSDFFMVREYPCNYVAAEDIMLKEDAEEEVEPPRTLIFDPEQIREASMMISELNTTSNLTAEMVEDRIFLIIKTELRKILNKAKVVATLGFIVRFSNVDKNVTVVEVSVDPSFGKEPKFITATLDSNDSIVAQYPNR